LLLRMLPGQQFGHLLIGLNVGARYRCQAAIHVQRGGFDPIKALSNQRKAFARFLPKRPDFAFQTFLDID
jgi:hypothetical protein